MKQGLTRKQASEHLEQISADIKKLFNAKKNLVKDPQWTYGEVETLNNASVDLMMMTESLLELAKDLKKNYPNRKRFYR